jgi:hypothetical protein
MKLEGEKRYFVRAREDDGGSVNGDRGSPDSAGAEAQCWYPPPPLLPRVSLGDSWCPIATLRVAA